jgi:hypothetical protein
MPIILCLAFVQLGIYIWKYLKGYWTLPLAIGNTINNILFAIMVAVMLNDNSLFHEGFFLKAVKIFAPSATSAMEWSERSRWICMVVIIAICIGESVAGFIKSTRSRG